MRNKWPFPENLDFRLPAACELFWLSQPPQGPFEVPTCGTGAFSLSPLEHISLFLHISLKIDLGSLHQKAPRSTRFHSRGYWSSAKSDGRNGIYARFRSRKVIQRGHRVQNYFVAGPIDKSVCTWAQAGPRPKIGQLCFACLYSAVVGSC